MDGCQACGTENALLHTCNECGAEVCPDHQLPEAHDCPETGGGEAWFDDTYDDVAETVHRDDEDDESDTGD